MRSLEFERWVEDARAVPIEDVARARAPTLKRQGRELMGPCPVCGGKDRFGVNLRKQVFLCRSAGKGGDVIALQQYLDGCDFLQACETLTGRPPPGRDAAETWEERQVREKALAERAQAARAEEAQRERAELDFRERERLACFRLWRRGVPIAGTAAEAYLALRAIAAPADAHLRFSAEHPYFGSPRPGQTGRQEFPVIHRGPALLAAILGPTGRFAGLHATWIDLEQADGKARLVDAETGEVLPARKARGSTKGGRIELVRRPAPKRLFLGEGRETVLAAWCELRDQAPELAAESAFWSAIDLGNLGGRAFASVPHPTDILVDKAGRERPRMVPGPDPDPAWPAIPIPDCVEQLFLLGDGDSDSFATRCALQRAATRYARPWRTVHGLMAPPGEDWNDVRRRRAA